MKYAIPLLAFLCGLRCAAQHETDKWYFGNDEGLDFSQGCAPVVLSDGMIQGFEGCSTMSDRYSGDLLFYTNSSQIWGRDHAVMPNGEIQPIGVTYGQNTITQVIAVRVPEHDSLYYVLTNQIQGDFGGFGMRLACVDMTLNNGNGDVVFKDSIVYADTVSEKGVAIPNQNGTDIWVVGHQNRGDAFFALLITPQGIQGPAIVSHVGKHYEAQWTDIDMIGEMKANPSGNKLAVVTAHQPDIEMFDFNPTTGVVSNPIRVAAIGGYMEAYENSWWYGASFSPDGTKLYAARQNFGLGTESIVQIDVSSGDSATIAASKIVISTLGDCFSMQLAPNGKIYTRRIGNYLGAINYPDSAGTSCDFDPQAVDFGYDPAPLLVWGFNNYIAPKQYGCQGSAIGMNEALHGRELFSAAPNPCGQHTTIHLPSPSDAVELDLYEGLSGRIVRSIAVPRYSSQYSLDLGGIISGFYVLRASQHDRAIGTIKLIVEP